MCLTLLWTIASLILQSKALSISKVVWLEPSKHTQKRCKTPKIKHSTIQYIYTWCSCSFHLSGLKLVYLSLCYFHRISPKEGSRILFHLESQGSQLSNHQGLQHQMLPQLDWYMSHLVVRWGNNTLHFLGADLDMMGRLWYQFHLRMFHHTLG